jgi:hypothetical protein
MDDRFIRTSRTTNWVTLYHIPDEMNLLKNSCENSNFTHKSILHGIFCGHSLLYILENNSAPFSQVNKKGTHSVGPLDNESTHSILFYSLHSLEGGGGGKMYVFDDASTNVLDLQDPLDVVSPYCKQYFDQFSVWIQQIYWSL